MSQIASRAASVRSDGWSASSSGWRRACCAAMIRAGIASTGATMSTAPVAMALAGIPSCCGPAPPSAPCGDPCAKVRPPQALIAFSPSAPSLPVPDSTTPIASSRSAAASESKNVLIGLSSRGSSS